MPFFAAAVVVDDADLSLHMDDTAPPCAMNGRVISQGNIANIFGKGFSLVLPATTKKKTGYGTPLGIIYPQMITSAKNPKLPLHG